VCKGLKVISSKEKCHRKYELQMCAKGLRPKVISSKESVTGNISCKCERRAGEGEAEACCVSG